MISMGIQSKFKKFHENIHLTRQDDAYQEAREKDDEITAAIKQEFRSNGYPVIDDFIQGSLKTFTTIKQPGKDFDIDRAIVIAADDTCPDDPLIPKRIVQKVLEKRNFKDPKIKKPCVTADYKNKDLHIDIPIYRKRENGVYEIAIGKDNSNEENKSWDKSSPLDLIQWVNSTDLWDSYKSEKLNQFRRLVQYLKRWRNITFGEEVCRKIYSIGLTVMVKNNFKPHINDEGFADDLSALHNTVASIIDYGGYFVYMKKDEYSVRVDLPVSPNRDIFNGSSVKTGTQLRNQLLQLKKALKSVIDEEDEYAQCEKLIKIFGDDFPEGKKNSSESSGSKAVYSTSGSVGTSQGA